MADYAASPPSSSSPAGEVMDKPKTLQEDTDKILNLESIAGAGDAAAAIPTANAKTGMSVEKGDELPAKAIR